MVKYETGQWQLDRRKKDIRHIRPGKGQTSAGTGGFREINSSKIPIRFLLGWLGGAEPLPTNEIEEIEIIGWG